TSFAGPVILSGSTTGVISNAVPIVPASSGDFTDGIWAGNIMVTQPATNMVLFARDASGHVGQSTAFTARGVTHFDIRSVATLQLAGEPFSITVTALDDLNLPVTNFAGPVTFSGSVGAMAPAVSGGFTAGVWAGNVAALQPAASMTLRAQDA